MHVSKRFFGTTTTQLAADLLGSFLVHDSPEGQTIGRIVETEAYLYHDDPACHASRGMTKRNEVMFGPPGTTYVYLIYGMYHCFNVVSGKIGEGEAVLIRALEPVSGIPLMEQRRRRTKLLDLCSGPGKLVHAMGIGPEHIGSCLRTSNLSIYKASSLQRLYRGNRDFEITCTTRIGITKAADLPLRFYIKGSEFVSRP